MLVQQSQQYIAEAEQHLHRGEIEQAREQFRRAAVLQHQFIESLPPDRVRTHSVYGLSTATLYFRAHQLDIAARLAHSLLAQEWIEPYSASKLEELLARIRSERLLAGLGSRVPQHPTSSSRRVSNSVRVEVMEGILRAVDLDRKKLSLDQPDGTRLPLTLSSVGFEDVLGPMLNKRVIVTGYVPPRRKQWIVTGIDFAPAA